MISREKALMLSTFVGFTGAGKIYLGDLVSGILKLILLIVFINMEYFTEDPELVIALRMVFFSIICSWWVVEIIETGYLISIPGKSIPNSPNTWNDGDEHEHMASSVVAFLFAGLVYYIPEWAPLQIHKIKA